MKNITRTTDGKWIYNYTGVTPADTFIGHYMDGSKVVHKQDTKQPEKVDDIEIQTGVKVYVVNRPTINIYEFDDKDSEVIGKLHKGDRLCIFDGHDGWAGVVGGGYIRVNSIKKVEG